MSLSPNFSNHPGCWEQQLIRRYDNPLFPESTRNVLHQQVVEAREKDKKERQAFQRKFEDAVKKVSELPEKADAEQLLTLIPELSQCYSDGMTLCIDLPKELQALTRLLTLFEETLIKNAGEESDFLQQIEQQRAERKIQQELLQNRVIAAMMRENSPISADELPATLLSETPDRVRSIFPLLDLEQQNALYQQMSTLIEQSTTIELPLPQDAEEVHTLLRSEIAAAEH